MEDTNFYSYMNGQRKVAFDELSETVDLSSPESIQKAFEAYLEDSTPPGELKEAFLDEKFHTASENEKEGKIIQYNVSIPGAASTVDKDTIKSYFEEFINRIGGDTNADSPPRIEVEIMDDERGGVLVEVYVAIEGKAVQPR